MRMISKPLMVALAGAHRLETTKPEGKIPAIYGPNGPSGRPLALFESGAILLLSCQQDGKFISADPNTRYETIQWVMWQMGGVGPMSGQVCFFNKFAGPRKAASAAREGR